MLFINNNNKNVYQLFVWFNEQNGVIIVVSIFCFCGLLFIAKLEIIVICFLHIFVYHNFCLIIINNNY